MTNRLSMTLEFEANGKKWRIAEGMHIDAATLEDKDVRKGVRNSVANEVDDMMWHVIEKMRGREFDDEVDPVGEIVDEAFEFWFK